VAERENLLAYLADLPSRIRSGTGEEYEWIAGVPCYRSGLSSRPVIYALPDGSDGNRILH